MNLIEVKLLDFTVLVSFDDSSTVASVSSAAVAEYQSFNFKKSPQKVVYTKDTKGRVLSGGLKIVQHKIDTVLEVVVEDYSDNDAIVPKDVESLYRQWQLWTISQIKELVQALAHKVIPPLPEEVTLSLLLELSKSPAENIQLQSVKVLQILMTKFPQRELIQQAVDRICELFSETPFADVAVAALESFRGLSPLQFKLFDGNKHLRAMFDVQTALLRFSPDTQGRLFAAFESLSLLLGDKELQSVVLRKAGENAAAGDDDNELLSMKDLEQSDGVGDVQDSTPEVVISVTNQPSPADGENEDHAKATPTSEAKNEPVASDHSNQAKKFNLSRVLSLLASEDAQIRLYTLEKLHSRLITEIDRHSGINSLRHSASIHLKQSTDDLHIQSARREVETSHSEHNTDIKPDASRQHRVLSANRRNSREISNSTGGALFTSEREVDSLVRALFTCLKSAIHSRQQPAAGANANNIDKTKPKRIPNSDPTAKQPTSTATDSKNRGLSTAARLIQTALKSPLSDINIVRLAVNCLWQLVHFPQRIELTPLDQHEAALRKRSRVNKMNGTAVTSLQRAFMHSAREWYRLLLTLSHADENCSERFHSDVADKCAYLFSLVVLQGLRGGWKDAGIKLEPEAVSTFLGVQNKPDYRLYLGLTYLAHLSHMTSANKLAPHHLKDQVATAQPAAEVILLKNLLLCNNGAIFSAVWRWASGPLTNHRARQLAMQCISELSTFAEVVAVFINLDPVPMLLDLLAHAVRDPEQEKLNFSPAYQHTSQLHHRTLSYDSDGETAVGAAWDFDGSDTDSDESAVERRRPGYDSDPEDINSLGSYYSSEEESIGHRLKRLNTHNTDRSGLKGRRKVSIRPDILLIRLVLKTLANLFCSPVLIGGSAYSKDHIVHHAVSVLAEMHVGSIINIDSDGKQLSQDSSSSVKLRRIVKRDEISQFYYSLIKDMQ